MRIEDISVGMVCNVAGGRGKSFIVIDVNRESNNIAIRDSKGALSLVRPGMVIRKTANYIYEEDVNEYYRLIKSIDGEKLAEIHDRILAKAVLGRRLVYAKYVILYLREYINSFYIDKSADNLARFASHIGGVLGDVELYYPSYNEADGFLAKSEVDVVIGTLTNHWFNQIVSTMCMASRKASLVYRDAIATLLEYREAKSQHVQPDMLKLESVDNFILHGVRKLQDGMMPKTLRDAVKGTQGLCWADFIEFRVREDSSVCIGSQRFGAVIDKLCLEKNVPGLNIDAYIKQQGLSIREIDYAYYILSQILSVIDENIVQLDILGDITRFACDVSSVISGCELKLSPNKDLVKSLKVYEVDTIIEYLLSVRRNTTENSILYCGIDKYVDESVSLIKQKREEYITDFDKLCVSKNVSARSVYKMIDDAIRTEGLSKRGVDKVVVGLYKLWSKLQPGEISIEQDVDYMISLVRAYFTAERYMGSEKANLILKFALDQYTNYEDKKPAKLDLGVKVVIYDESINRDGIEDSIKATFGEDTAIIRMPSGVSYDTALYLIHDSLVSRSIKRDKVVFLSGNTKSRHFAKSFGFNAMSVR